MINIYSSIKKKLNIFKDRHNSDDYDEAFILSRNIDYYKTMYLIDENGHEYKLYGTEADYIDRVATSMFDFNKIRVYDDYDFILKIVDLKTNSTKEYFLKISNNNMFIIDSDRMSKLNRTDYEYLKKILVINHLYEF